MVHEVARGLTWPKAVARYLPYFRALLAGLRWLAASMLMFDDEEEDEEPSYAEEADALLDQMRQLRESMQQESGILQQKAHASE